MRSGLAICIVLLVLAGPAAGQEIRPTLDKIKETGVVRLGHREASRPFSFRGSDGQPAGFSVDLCLQVVGALRESLKLPGIKVAWVPVTPADRIAKLVKGTIDLECGSTTITFGRMEQVAFSHMISVDGGSLLATADSGIGAVKDLAGKRVGVIPNTTTEKALAAALAGASIQVTVIPVTEHGEGLLGSRGGAARRLRLGSHPARGPAGHLQGAGEAPPERRVLLVRAVRAHAASRGQRFSSAGEPHALHALPLRARPDLRAVVRALHGGEPAGESPLPPSLRGPGGDGR